MPGLGEKTEIRGFSGGRVLCVSRWKFGDDVLGGGVMGLEFYCTCGNPMCANVNVDRHGRNITIDPCEKCLEAEYEEGRNAGIEEGSGE